MNKTQFIIVSLKDGVSVLFVSSGGDKMKKISVLLATLFVLAFALALAQPTQASPDNPTSMNARMTHWQEETAVIHILVWSDAGRVGPAEVEVGQPLLFGFEWSGGNCRIAPS